MHHPFNDYVGEASAPGAGLHALLSDRFVPRILLIFAGFPLIFSILGFHGWFFPAYIPEAVGPDSYTRTSPDTLALVSLSIFCVMAVAVWKHRSFYKTVYFVFRDSRGGEDVLHDVGEVVKREGAPFFGYTMSSYSSRSGDAEFTLEVRAPRRSSFSSEAIAAGLKSSGFVDVRRKGVRSSEKITMAAMRVTN